MLLVFVDIGDTLDLNVLSTETMRLLNQPAHVISFAFAVSMLVHLIKPIFGRHVIALGVILLTSISLLFSLLLIPLVLVSVRSLFPNSVHDVDFGPMENYARAVWKHLVLLLLAVFVLAEAWFPMVSSRVRQNRRLSSTGTSPSYQKLLNEDTYDDSSDDDDPIIEKKYQ